MDLFSGFSSHEQITNISLQVLLSPFVECYTPNSKRHVLKPETTKRNDRNERNDRNDYLFQSFRFARFGGFGGFARFVSLVSVVSVVSFRWFRFVVSGFSTCHSKMAESCYLALDASFPR